MAGLTSTGFLALRLDEVRAEIEARWRTEFGANADLSADSPDGQIVGIFAEREAALWEQMTAVYAAGFIDSAAGVPLDELAAFAGLSRLQESASTVTLTAAGVAGTVLPVGRVVRLDDSETLWALAAATIGGGGTVDVLATAQVVGPTTARSSSAPTFPSTWTIVTPVTGWAGVTNALDAEVGRVVESNESLRARIRRGYVTLGAIADGIRSAVSRVADVEEVIVAQNTTYATDNEGRPPKSFEVIVRGGDDNAIAQAIWSTKPDGIEAYGDGVDSGTATTVLGTFETIPFTRPAEIDVWIEVDITINQALFPAGGVASVAAEVLTYEDGLTVGEDVVPFEIIQGIETPGIVSAVVRVGRANPPTQTSPLEIGSREIAALDSSRIVVTEV